MIKRCVDCIYNRKDGCAFANVMWGKSGALLSRKGPHSGCFKKKEVSE